MRIDKQKDQQASNLILCLSGWSAPPELFRHIHIPENMDLWVAYDYRDLSLDEDLTRYASVHLIAWSLGVWVAEYVWAGKRTFATATAINGTPCPINDSLGIPVGIFEGTLAKLDADGMRRFNRRMCGDRATYERYTRLPARPLEETREELRVLHDRILTDNRDRTVGPALTKEPFWSRSIISTDDRIFPTENLRNYWRGRCPTREIEAPHLPFYQFQSWEELWK